MITVIVNSDNDAYSYDSNDHDDHSSNDNNNNITDRNDTSWNSNRHE